MKTKIVVKAPLSKNEEHLILDPPYTVFGHSTLDPKFSLIMQVKGLREMLEDLSDDDSFRIEFFHDRPVEYSFIKKIPSSSEAPELNYHLVVDVESAEGSQTFGVSATSLEEAERKFRAGDGDFVESDVEVTGLADFDYSQIYKASP